MNSIRLLVLLSTNVVHAILHRKCDMGQFLKSYPQRAFANPMAFFALHVEKIARLQHNRVNTPLLQKNIGKIMFFSVFKESWQ